MASHLLGKNMSTPMRLVHSMSYLCTTVHIFVVAVMLLSLRRACTSQMTAVEPSRKLLFWPERDVKGHDPVSYPTCLMASLVTTSRMQQCFNVPIDSYHEFLLLFYCCVLLEIKLTTTTGVGVTKTPFVLFSVSKVFDLAKVTVKVVESH